MIGKGYFSYLFIILISLFLIAFNSSAATWTTEAVDAPKRFDDFYSRALAVDTDGHPHIAYGEDHLYYAFYDGTSWNYETVDLSTAVGTYASIALDTSVKSISAIMVLLTETSSMPRPRLFLCQTSRPIAQTGLWLQLTTFQ